MAEWLRLKNIQPHAGPSPSPDVLFDVVVSPYDVPEAVRGFRTAQENFRVEFRYIDGEEPSRPPERIGEHIKVFRGRITHRLLAIEVDVEAIGAQSVGLTISTAVSHSDRAECLKRELMEAFERLVATQTEDVERWALETTRDALETRAEDLINQLVGA